MDIRYLFSRAGTRKQATYTKMIERLMDDAPVPKIGFYQAAYNLADELILKLGKRGSMVGSMYEGTNTEISEMNRQQIDYVASIGVGELVMGVVRTLQKYGLKDSKDALREINDEDFKSPKDPFNVTQPVKEEVKKIALQNISDELTNFMEDRLDDETGKKKPKIPEIVNENMDVVMDVFQGMNADNFIGYLVGFMQFHMMRFADEIEGDDKYDPKVDDPANYVQAEFDDDEDFSDEFTEANKMEKWFDSLRK